MTTFNLISEELMKQEIRTSMITKKSFETIAKEVVGKWCIMVQSSTGKVGVGIHECKDSALEMAKNEAV